MTDAKARLLQMIADEPHMAGGGLLKAVGKAQKVAKKAKMYSAVDKALEASKRGAGTGMEFANELSKTSGIKKAELVDRGIMVPSKKGPVLNPALTQLPKMTKQEFVSHLNEKYKPPGVRKITLGAQNLTNEIIDKKAMQMMADDVNDYVDRYGDADYDEVFNSRYRDDYEEYYRKAKESLAEESGAKYGKYKLPGGENYRENLYQYENPAGKAFYQGHFDEPNVLYHMRQTDRIEPTYTSAQIDAIGQRMAEAMGVKQSSLASGAPILMMRQGVISPLEAAQFSHAKGFQNMDIDMTPAQRRALHIEEIQSDWHQKGRDQGYGPKTEEIVEAYYMTKDGQRIPIGFGKTKEEAEANIDVGWKNLVDIKYETSEKKIGEGMPDAPFKKNWHELALKQALMDAAEGDYDQLLITPGAEQAKRFDLSQQIDAVEWNTDNGRLYAKEKETGDYRKIADNVTADNIADYVGKETASKLIEQPLSGSYKQLSGLDLQVGGEGMAGFYDKMVPNYLNDLGKKYGVRVGERAIEGEVPYSKTTPTLADVQRLAQEMYGVSDLQAISALPLEQRNALNQVFADRVKAKHTTKLHTFDITPEMREDILNNGLPMYQRGGVVHMAGGGRTPKYPWERYPQTKKVPEMRARQITPVAGAVKKAADYATQLIDKGPSFSSLVGNLVDAIPFKGPDLRKRMEASDISIPTGFTLGSNMPAEDYEYGQPMQYKKPGISTTSVPTKDVLKALNVSDLVGTPGLSKVAEDIGYGKMPDPLDLLDAASVAALGYGAVKGGIKGAKAAQQGALSAAKAAERFAEKKVPEVMERGGMGAQMLGAFGQNTQSNVVKPTGGNWIGGRVEKELGRLKSLGVNGTDPVATLAELEKKYGKQGMEEVLAAGLHPMLKENAALNKWIDSNLGNYVKKQMATPDDPVRKLGEQGITHKASLLDEYQDSLAPTEQRVSAGFPAEGVGQSPLARSWENASDEAVAAYNAGEIQNAPQKAERIKAAKQKVTQELEALNQQFENHVRSFGLKENEVQGLMKTMTPTEKAKMVGNDSFIKANLDYLEQGSPVTESQAKMMEENPWIAKVDPNSSVYSPHIGDLGFDHIVDVLNEDLANGRIRPEQLNKISMEQAVRRTYEYDQEMAKKMRETQAKVTEGMPVHKEYPEGYKWIELTSPKKELPSGWSVKEALNPMSGKQFQVFDENGSPIAGAYGKTEESALGSATKQLGRPELEQALKYEGNKMGHCVGGYCPDVVEGKSRIFSLRDAKGEPHVTIETTPGDLLRTFNKLSQEEQAAVRKVAGSWASDEALFDAMRQVVPEKAYAPDRIVQIKGKQNRAPKEDYLPFVQDFVKGGAWEEVGDLQNTGLRPYKGDDGLKYVTPEEYEIEIRKELGLTPPEGMAEGGEVKSFFEEKSAKQRLLDMIAEEPHMGIGVRPSRLQLQGEIANDTYGGIGGGGRATYTYPIGSDAAIRAYIEGGGYKPKNEDYKGQVNNMGISYEMGFKDGGEVHMAGGGISTLQKIAKAAKAAEAAKKAAEAAAKAAKVDHPLVFPRAAAKTINDIRPIAQRMADQMTGNFVKQNPKVTTNPAGKSRKQFERERSIPLETRNVVPERPAPDVNYEDYMGYGLVGVPGDPTMGGVAKRGSLEATAQPTVELTRVGDITPDYPVPLFGGPRYGDDKKFWASNFTAAVPIQKNASKLADKYESSILAKYIKMGSGSENFALHNLDALLSIQRPEKLDKAKMAQLTEAIQAGSPKYGKFPGFTGFKDPADVLLQAQMDSNLRKHIAETLTKPTITDQLGLPNGLDVVAAITYPELRNLETGASGFSVGKMKPGAELQRGQSSHPTYDTDIPGSFLGRSRYPTPYEIAFPDTTAYARSQMTPGVQEFNMMKMLGPRERIDQQYIDEIKMYEQLMKQYTGKKKGGLAHSKKVKRHGNTVPH